MAELSVFVETKNILGESPFWHKKRQSVFWVDIEEGMLYERMLKSGSVSRWHPGRKISAILSAEGSYLLLGCQDGIARFELDTEKLTVMVPLEADKPRQRCNDGTFDGQGRIWIGNMDMHCKEGFGSLYCIDESLNPIKQLDNLTIPNGVVSSVDQSQLYFIDTPTQTVKAYTIGARGILAFERTAISIPLNMGMPDGMAMDEQGMLWIALYGGAAIGRWNPLNGQLMETISIPALHVTNCCFAGDELDQLVVTSALENLSSDQLSNYPLSGSVFIVRNLGVRGAKMQSHKPSTTFFQ